MTATLPGIGIPAQNNLFSPHCIPSAISFQPGMPSSMIPEDSFQADGLHRGRRLPARGRDVYDGSLVMGNMMNAAADLGVASCWVHRAKEEFESEEGKAILKKLGIEGDYEGIGNLILGYAAKPAAEAAPRKADYIYSI